MNTPLISVQTLYSLLTQHNTDIVVIDCRHQLSNPDWGGQAYAEGHIPSAVFLSLDRDFAGVKTGNNGRHPLPNTEKIVQTLSKSGVGNETCVVVYDQGDMMYAARLWWQLRFLGHQQIRVLDGGLKAWLTADLPISQSVDPRPEKQFIVREALTKTVDVDFVLDNLKTQKYQVIDARGAERFRGENESMDPVGGHIPNAKNRPFVQNLDEKGLMKSPEQLQQEWAAFGDTRLQIHQCGSGVSACVNLLAQAVAGLEGGALYVGSWSEWSTNPDRPIAKGA